MTMKELAKLANVSVSTVSKAFAEADDVSEETKNHIFNIAKEYGCYGKFFKGKYSKKIIAIICSELCSSFYTNFVVILQNMIEEQNGIAIVSADNFSTSKQAELIEYFASYLKVDGIIVFNLKTKLKKGYDIPIISIFSSDDDNVDSIKTNSNEVIHESVETLKKLGHKNIVFMGESLTKGREKVFKDATEKIMGYECKCFSSKFRFEKAGEDCVEQMINSRQIPTAIICGYDYIAFGVIKKLKEYGYSVPEDISVIGVDNISVSEYIETGLSSIDINAKEFCLIALDLINKKLKNKYFRAKQQITVNSKLVLRGSVRSINETTNI